MRPQVTELLPTAQHPYDYAPAAPVSSPQVDAATDMLRVSPESQSAGMPQIPCTVPVADGRQVLRSDSNSGSSSSQGAGSQQQHQHQPFSATNSGAGSHAENEALADGGLSSGDGLLADAMLDDLLGPLSGRPLPAGVQHAGVWSACTCAPSV